MTFGLRFASYRALLWMASATVVGALGCTPALNPPNVLVVVWDTVRADRLSAYGYSKLTTPFLETWLRKSLWFSDAVSTAGSTTPSHASIFTGLLPIEHGTFGRFVSLDAGLTTLAEQFRESGYATYMYAANINLARNPSFHQGFDRIDHPFSREARPRAQRIVAHKLRSGGADAAPPNRAHPEARNVGASGALAQPALLRWLAGKKPDRPYFAFLNYMEAHQPTIPPRALREQMLSPDQVRRSFALDRRTIRGWTFTFGLSEYEDGELEIVGGTYDAALLELDRLFEKLLAALDAAGHLDDTVVVLTSDHGDHLGDHHIMGHQYSLKQSLLHVPLVLHHPTRVAPGRSDAPVSLLDLYPTLLDLSGIDIPGDQQSTARSLLSPDTDRVRMAEYLRRGGPELNRARELHPGFLPTPWTRRLRAVFRHGDKLICATDGTHQLYGLRDDPTERQALERSQPERAQKLLDELAELSRTVRPPADSSVASHQLSPEDRASLEALGYLGELENGGPASDEVAFRHCGL